MRVVVAIALAFALAPATSVAADSRGEAFQGIPWGASVEQISARFPGKLITKTCTPDQRSRDLKPWRACGSPLLSHYEVGGVPFEVQFYMLHNGGGLGAVALDQTGTISVAELETRKLEPAAWYGTMKRLLMQRYGAPVGEDVQDGNEKLPTTNSRWLTPDTELVLTLTTMDLEGIGMMYTLMVTYLPMKDSEADKL